MYFPCRGLGFRGLAKGTVENAMAASFMLRFVAYPGRLAFPQKPNKCGLQLALQLFKGRTLFLAATRRLLKTELLVDTVQPSSALLLSKTSAFGGIFTASGTTPPSAKFTGHVLGVPFEPWSWDHAPDVGSQLR